MKNYLLTNLSIVLISFLTGGCTSNNYGFTIVTIQNDDFHINGVPTLEGIEWRGINMEGLLPNSRMFQDIFDNRGSENPEFV